MPRYRLAPIHGFADLPFDHAIMPWQFWQAITVLPNECWSTSDPSPRRARDTLVLRAGRRNPGDVFAAVPTCGTWTCVNPAHICVTMKTALSEKERAE